MRSYGAFMTIIQSKRNKSLKEKKKSRQQELKENRVMTIETTFEEWVQDENKLVSEVRFLESNDIKTTKQVQLQIAEHSISFGKLIYIWSSRFPILPDTVVFSFY